MIKKITSTTWEGKRNKGASLVYEWTLSSYSNNVIIAPNQLQVIQFSTLLLDDKSYRCIVNRK